MKQTTFWRCFLEDSFNVLKHLKEKVTAAASFTHVWVVVNHTMPTPLQRSTKLKISHWYFDQCLCNTSRLQASWASVFFLHIFFTHIHLMICLSSVVNLIAVMTLTDVWYTPLLVKNFKKNKNYFYAVRISISLAILSEIFI